jgi:hypothetical protein
MKTDSRRKAAGIRSAILIASLVLAAGCAAASSSPAAAGEAFLAALRDGDFAEAAALSTDTTAGIVLFMEKMVAANNETREDLEFPIPPADSEIIHLESAGDGSVMTLRYSAGQRTFVLRAVEIQGTWKIELPRSSW